MVWSEIEGNSLRRHFAESSVSNFLRKSSMFNFTIKVLGGLFVRAVKLPMASTLCVSLLLAGAVVSVTGCERRNFDYGQRQAGKDQPKYDFQLNPQQPVRDAEMPAK